MNNKRIFAIISVALVLVGAYIFLFKGKTAPNEQPSGPQGNVADSMIVVSSPKAGDTLDAASGFTLTGKAVGQWFFEASAPVRIYNSNGILLTTTFISAQGDWMTTDFVDFKGEVAPFLTKGATEGFVQFENDNPSDNEGSRYVYKVNIKFPPQETQSIKLYFGNTIKNPNTIDCSLVYPAERIVGKVDSIGTLALNLLAKGPSDSEASSGFTSALTGKTVLKSLVIKDGIATADFSSLPSGGSCAVGQARAQIEQTLKQFSTVKSVKILLNGEAATALQP